MITRINALADESPGFVWRLQDEDGNASVTVGKEVADGVFVGTERSLGDGGTKVTVEIDVFEDVTIDTEIDSEGGASVGVEWKKDF